MTQMLFVTAVLNWIVAAAAVVAGIYLIKKINQTEEEIEQVEKKVHYLEMDAIPIKELLEEDGEDDG